MSNIVPPNQTVGKITGAELDTIREALGRRVSPPYVVAGTPDSPVLWTLQRASTPEGAEPGFMWPVYVDPEGRQVAGARVAKAAPNPTVPL